MWTDLQSNITKCSIINGKKGQAFPEKKGQFIVHPLPGFEPQPFGYQSYTTQKLPLHDYIDNLNDKQLFYFKLIKLF